MAETTWTLRIKLLEGKAAMSCARCDHTLPTVPEDLVLIVEKGKAWAWCSRRCYEDSERGWSLWDHVFGRDPGKSPAPTS